MIRFMIGLMTVITGVAGLEGTLPILLGGAIAFAGIAIMFWGLYGMAEKGQLS